MPIAIICIDRPGAIEIRKANRDAHLAHIRGSGKITQAGPFLDADGEMCGSLLIMETDEMAEAEAWAAADPYKAADLFERVEIRTWKRVIG